MADILKLGYEFHAIKTMILKILDKAILWGYSDNSFNMYSLHMH